MKKNQPEQNLNQLRYICILSGAKPNDLIHNKNGSVYDTEKAIKNSIKYSKTKPSLSHSFLRYIVFLYFSLNGLQLTRSWMALHTKQDNTHIKKAIHDVMNMLKKTPHLNENETEQIEPFLQDFFQEYSSVILGSGAIINFVIVLLLYKTHHLTLQKQFALKTRQQNINQNHSIYSTFRTFLNRYIWNEPTLNDDPIYQQMQSFKISKTSKTYAETNECLDHLYDQRFHKLFIKMDQQKYNTTALSCEPYNTPQLCSLRKKIMDIHHPVVYTRKSLAPHYFFRLDGSPRESVAEIALAIAYHWKLSDSVVSSALHMSRTLHKSFKQVFTMKHKPSKYHKTKKHVN